MNLTRFDFVLSEDEFSRIVFKFFPNESRCHLFDMGRPKTHNNIYKTYFNYRIYFETNYESSDFDPKVIWDCECDECSVIDQVAYVCQQISDGVFSIEAQKGSIKRKSDLGNISIEHFSDGIIWTIKKVESSRRRELWGQNMIEYYWRYEILMRRSFDGAAFVFELSRDRLRVFGDYLEFCFNYMLEHGEPI